MGDSGDIQYQQSQSSSGSSLPPPPMKPSSPKAAAFVEAAAKGILYEDEYRRGQFLILDNLHYILIGAAIVGSVYIAYRFFSSKPIEVDKTIVPEQLVQIRDLGDPINQDMIRRISNSTLPQIHQSPV